MRQSRRCPTSLAIALAVTMLALAAVTVIVPALSASSSDTRSAPAGGTASVPVAKESHAAAGGGARPSPAAAVKYRPQLGIDVDEYLTPFSDVASRSKALVRYVKSLHANAISISFPFFVSGPKSSRVYATASTPTPAQLAVTVRDARKAGLYVQIRPLLDERDLGDSRPHWAPPDLAIWFASYQKFLLPYATMAQRAGANDFCVGAELTVFQTSPRWNALDAVLRGVFKRRLSFAHNWSTRRLYPQAGGPGVVNTVDAYPPFKVPSTASTATLIKLWKAWDRTVPRRMGFAEIGIAAQNGAYSHPWEKGSPSQPINRAIQVRWFAAACAAVKASRLPALYVWSVEFDASLTVSPGRADANSFIASAGAAEIASCFSALRAAG